MEKQEQEERKHIEALDRKIERLQEKVIKKHKEYSVLAEELSALLDERHPERKIERAKQALYDAYVESERSLDEIIDLIRNAMNGYRLDLVVKSLEVYNIGLLILNIFYGTVQNIQ